LGAAINSTNGLITWRPTIAQSPSTNLVSVVVTESGTPPMSATQTFSVAVLRPATPVLSSPAAVGGAFRCQISGSVGPEYSIYATTNLTVGWQLLLVTNPVALPFYFADPTPVGAQRFYRVLLGP